MSEDRDARPGIPSVLRVLAFFLAVVCAWTAIGSLVICLFTLPEAWFMVLLWAALAGLLGSFAVRGRRRPAESRPRSLVPCQGWAR